MTSGDACIALYCKAHDTFEQHFCLVYASYQGARAPGATDESCPEWDHVVQAHACCADSAAAAAAACAACEPTSWRALPPPRCVHTVNDPCYTCILCIISHVLTQKRH